MMSRKNPLWFLEEAVDYAGQLSMDTLIHHQCFICRSTSPSASSRSRATSRDSRP
ncbi:hypothetical protein ACFL0H_13270 [Thermodesulfobacteriota bacterium]